MQLLARTWIHLLKILSLTHLRVGHLRCINTKFGACTKVGFGECKCLGSMCAFWRSKFSMFMKRFLIFEIQLALIDIIDIYKSFQKIQNQFYDMRISESGHKEEIFNDRSSRHFFQDVISNTWTSRSDHQQEILKHVLLNSIYPIWILWCGCCCKPSSLVSFIWDHSLKITLYDHFFIITPWWWIIDDSMMITHWRSLLYD